jgi:sugar lactone lactonase YvrE
MSHVANPVGRSHFSFGEGLRWHAPSSSLMWVDLSAGRLHRSPLAELDQVETLVDLDEPLGAFAPCSFGGWLLASGQGLSWLRDDGTVVPLVTLEPASVRMNDAGCDLQGRFWTGSMAFDESEGAGSLFRVNLDGTVDRVITGITVANGPAFSPDGRTLYLNDSGRQVTLAYDLDPRSGALSGEREFLRHSEGAGDGLIADDAGDLWIAMFGGSAVHHFDSTGRLLDRIEVSASQVSSCCVAEGQLFMTTVREGLDDNNEVDAGRLFAAPVDASGPSVRAFRGALPARQT